MPDEPALGHFQGLQEPDSGHRAADRGRSFDAGIGQVSGLLSGDDLCGLSGWGMPGRQQSGDPAAFPLSLLQVLAQSATGGLPLGCTEDLMKNIQWKSPRLRLDETSYRELHWRILQRDPCRFSETRAEGFEGRSFTCASGEAWVRCRSSEKRSPIPVAMDLSNRRSQPLRNTLLICRYCHRGTGSGH